MAGNLATSGRIVLVATDLMRQSRVAEAARALGYAIAIATTAEEARDALRGDAGAGAIVILDLQAEGLAWRDVVTAASSVPVIAFGQHTKPDVLRAAKAAGCRLAVPRSRLVAQLPKLIEKRKEHRDAQRPLSF